MVIAWLPFTEDNNRMDYVIMEVQFNISMNGFRFYPIITKSSMYCSFIGIVLTSNLHLLFATDDVSTDVHGRTIR